MILLPFDPPSPLPPNSIGPGSRMTFYRPAPTTFLLPGPPRKKCLWPGRAPSDQHSITRALPHLKRSTLQHFCTPTSTLHHFCAPTSQNDRHSITFTLLHLKTINTQFLLQSHILIRAASSVLAVNTGHILVLRRKTCALLTQDMCCVES